MLAELFSNNIFISGVIAGLVAQFLKMVVISIENKRFVPIAFLELAGMPSAHTAVIIALTSSTYLSEGITTSFVVFIAFSLYVVIEVLSVDRDIGKHAERIDKLIKILK